MSKELTLNEHKQAYTNAKSSYEYAIENKLSGIAKHESWLVDYHALSITHWQWRGSPLPITKADYITLRAKQDKEGF